MSPRSKKTDIPKAASAPVAYTRKCLAEEIATEFKKINVSMAYEVVQITIEKIKGALLAGRDVQFREFGVLERVVRKPRPGRNPRKPTDVLTIPERATIRFKPSRHFKAELNSGK